MTSYTQKLNAFKPTTRWTVEAEGVRWEELEKDKRSGFISIDMIHSVRLRFEPSRFEFKRVGLHIYTPRDHSITNIHFSGVMKFEHQEKSFNEFVIAFHEIFPSHTKTIFHQGSTQLAFIGHIAIAAFVILLLMFLAPLISVTGIPGATSIFRIVVILISLPIFFKFLKKNRPATYRPENLPKNMLERNSRFF